MRNVLTIGLALGLLLAIPGLGGAALAQNDTADDEGEQAEEEALSVSSECLQLRCQFEVTGVEETLGENATVAWTFGEDEATAEGSVVAHTYEEPGTYEVQATATATDDNQTRTANATTTVTVEEREIPWEALALGAGALVGCLALARLT